MPFSSLDPTKIIETTELLERRVHERFPSSSLFGVVSEVSRLAREMRDSLDNRTWRQFFIKFSVVGGVALTAISVLLFLDHLALQRAPENWADSLQAADAAANDLVVIGCAVFFLLTLEMRLRRPRILRQLHRLRSLAHVIDMHQLTKDPEQLHSDGEDTESSPSRTLSPFELGRYLDYCSEMLSLVGKIAALLGRDVQDQVVLSAIDEVEGLTTGLSRKIWQKIMILLLQNDRPSRSGSA